MKNITLAMDDALLEQARSLAAKRGTTLNAMVRSLLADEVADEARIAAAKEGLRKLMDDGQAQEVDGYVWNRDEIYAEREDRLLSRLEHSPLRRVGGST